MAQLSGKAAAIKNERGGLVCRQFALQFVKLGVGDTDRRRDVAFVEFCALGPRVHNDRLIGFVLFGNILDGNRRITAWGFHPSGESVGKNFDIGVTKFFRLPGGFVAQLSGRPLAIKNKQRIFISRQLIAHFIKLAVRNADSRRNMPDGILGFVWPGINDHHPFGLRQFGVLLDEGHINDIMKFPVGRLLRLGGVRRQRRACTSNTEHHHEAQYQRYG